MTIHAFHYAVRGHAPFPFDMLRYDASFPEGERDAALIEAIARDPVAQADTVTINLVHVHEGRFWQATARRWASMGWETLDSTLPGVTSRRTLP